VHQLLGRRPYHAGRLAVDAGARSRARRQHRLGRGKIAAPHLLPYSASTFALAGFSERLAAEVRSRGIAVTTIYPGLMRTGSARQALFKGQHRAEYAWFSIADAIPGLAMHIGRAARRIADACALGVPHLVLTLLAQVAITVHGGFSSARTQLPRT
jgi:NAD(P)-dependent dehydrogenase (short-subunit alcohol dehydrogenase family)